MHFYYNPLNKACKSKTGAFARGSVVTFRIYWNDNGEMPHDLDASFVFFQDGKERKALSMQRKEDGFSVALRFNQIGLYFYYFRVGDEYFGCGKWRDGVMSAKAADMRTWQITVYEEHYSTPAWMKGGVMYQIFPDRFNKVGELPIADWKVRRSDWGGMPSYRPNEYGKVLNNDFFGGNLNGITEKLDYLQELGVTVIYLNPIFEAYSNHRYDTGDYLKIDGQLGTAEDLDRLVTEAKNAGSASFWMQYSTIRARTVAILTATAGTTAWAPISPGNLLIRNGIISALFRIPMKAGGESRRCPRSTNIPHPIRSSCSGRTVCSKRGCATGSAVTALTLPTNFPISSCKNSVPQSRKKHLTPL